MEPFSDFWERKFLSYAYNLVWKIQNSRKVSFWMNFHLDWSKFVICDITCMPYGGPQPQFKHAMISWNKTQTIKIIFLIPFWIRTSETWATQYWENCDRLTPKPQNSENENRVIWHSMRKDSVCTMNEARKEYTNFVGKSLKIIGTLNDLNTFGSLSTSSLSAWDKSSRG